MNTKLYVGNLPQDVSMEAVRQRFAECGVVETVHLPTDRGSGRMLGYAMVTMGSEADAKAAISKMNGAMFETRSLRVSEAGEERGGPRSKAAAPQDRVKITSQFRERANMTYELDCAGVVLAIKVFPCDSEVESWRIEATTQNVVGAADTAVSASAPTRALALQELARSWVEQSPSGGLRALDWPAITDAMSTVRAI